MLCEKCGQNEATVKFVQIENNKKTELHLCQTVPKGTPAFTPGFDLQQLLSSLFQSALPGAETRPPQWRLKKCPTCGRTIVDIQKTGRLAAAAATKFSRRS